MTPVGQGTLNDTGSTIAMLFKMQSHHQKRGKEATVKRKIHIADTP